MVATAVPINPDVLRWAVDEDGRGPEQLSESIHVDVTVLMAWLSGTEAPSKGEVSKLAEVLRRPRALFFLPHVPEQASAPPTFRQPPGAADRAGPLSLRAFRRALRVQRAVAWARRAGPVELPVGTQSSAPDAAAAAVRSWLAVSIEDQLKWRDDREALNAWRAALEARDILVFSLEIGADEVRGFSSWDPKAPMIALNVSKVSPAARTFTLGHELAHLVLRDDSACVEPMGLQGGPADDLEERWCEAFAAALLMPADAVRSLSRQRRFSSPANLDDVRAAMTAFRVSARAAALRLIELQLADRGLYGIVLAAFAVRSTTPERTPDEFRRPARSTTRVREYGGRTLATVLGAIPETDAMSVLRIDWEDVRELADKVPGVSAG